MSFNRVTRRWAKGSRMKIRGKRRRWRRYRAGKRATFRHGGITRAEAQMLSLGLRLNRRGKRGGMKYQRMDRRGNPMTRWEASRVLRAAHKHYLMGSRASKGSLFRAVHYAQGDGMRSAVRMTIDRRRRNPLTREARSYLALLRTIRSHGEPSSWAGGIMRAALVGRAESERAALASRSKRSHGKPSGSWSESMRFLIRRKKNPLTKREATRLLRLSRRRLHTARGYARSYPHFASYSAGQSRNAAETVMDYIDKGLSAGVKSKLYRTANKLRERGMNLEQVIHHVAASRKGNKYLLLDDTGMLPTPFVHRGRLGFKRQR